MKRTVDFFVALFGLMVVWPIILVAMIAVWLQDFRSPFYLSSRVGKDGVLFNLVKLRSMQIHSDQLKIDSTSANDPRITTIGRIIRAYKIDELPQLWNVLKGEMSLVGPRPNVKRETDLYTPVESKILSVKPGITDISSIVFSDLADILRTSQDPNLDYNQMVRPWKSRLSLLYIDNQSLWLDLRLVLLTVVALISRDMALKRIQGILEELQADSTLRRVALRQNRLTPHPPPGSTEIVTSR